MSISKIKLLDCTLRDGGYVNDWNWGFEKARSIIRFLVQTNIDIVEVGFLRDVEEYNPDISVCNYIEDLNKLLPENRGNSMFSAMAMRSNYDINKLSPYSGEGIEMIRITAHDYDIEEGLEFAQTVKDKGYKVSINPINIMGYSDKEILWIIDKVNEIEPYQFSIVDTFGSMKRRDLDRIVSLVDNNLKKNIRLALHLHENMSLSCSLAQQFVDKHLNRSITVDGSLMGMGRIPGNLPIELIADYINDYYGGNYDIDYLMDAIQDYIAPIKGESEWGYTPAYFLSARFNLHRNYAEYYLGKGDLTNRDINHILSRFDRSKVTCFDAEYADKMYFQYKDNKIDDTVDRENLKKIFQNNEILILAPGSSIREKKEIIQKYIAEKKPIVISVNFIPKEYKVDYGFFSNNKRIEILEKIKSKLIVTSNIAYDKADYKLNYNSLTGAFKIGCNSLLMLLKLCSDLGVKKVTLAGADGYSQGQHNYYDSHIRSYSEHDNEFNLLVRDALSKLNLEIQFLTPSLYERIGD